MVSGGGSLDFGDQFLTKNASLEEIVEDEQWQLGLALQQRPPQDTPLTSPMNDNGDSRVSLVAE